MKKRFTGILTLIVILATVTIVRSQPIYKIEDSKDIDMKLLGTSTLHKWSMDAKTFEGQAQFVFAQGSDSELSGIKSLVFALEVKDLKSESKSLDKNAYAALKTDQFKDIHYKLISAAISSERDSQYYLRTLGYLTIAGVTKEISMDILCVVNKDQTITCKGSEKLNMTDYQVKPPTFMLGAMKTGDAITLDFVLVYKKQKGI